VEHDCLRLRHYNQLVLVQVHNVDLNPCCFVIRLLNMLDDFEDDLVGLTNMDETPHLKSDWPSSGKSPKQRKLSQMAGSYPKRSKV